jgi:hypothetical protein
MAWNFMNTEPVIIDAGKEEKWLVLAKAMHDQKRRARVVNLTLADEEAICEFSRYRATSSKFTLEF